MLARLGVTIAEPGALVGFQLDQITDFDTAGAGEALHRTGRFAILEGGGLGRPALLDLAIRLALGQGFDHHRQTTRCGVGTYLTEGDFGVAQAIGEAVGEAVSECVDGARRQFFAAQFDQQGIHGGHAYASPSVVVSSAASSSSRSACGASGKPAALRES